MSCLSRVADRVPVCCLFATRFPCVWARANLIGTLVQRTPEGTCDTWNRKTLQTREGRYRANHRMPSMHARRKRQYGQTSLRLAPTCATMRQGFQESLYIVHTSMGVKYICRKTLLLLTCPKWWTTINKNTNGQGPTAFKPNLRSMQAPCEMLASCTRVERRVKSRQ